MKTLKRLTAAVLTIALLWGREVFPMDSSTDQAHVCLRGSVPFCGSFSGTAACQDVENLRLGEFCRPVGFTPESNSPSAHIAIGRIFCGGSWSEVAQVYASSVCEIADRVAAIAGMKNRQIIWYRSVSQNPSGPVRIHCYAMRPLEASIAVFRYVGEPEPALIGTAPFDLVPEPLFSRGMIGGRRATGGAKTTSGNSYERSMTPVAADILPSIHDDLLSVVVVRVAGRVHTLSRSGPILQETL